jgi:hypothetical protein
LLEVLGAENPLKLTSVPSVQPQRLPVRELVPAVQVLVKYLDAEIDVLMRSIHTPARSSTPFEQLKQFAVQVANTQSQRPYEVLLRPRILEGGQTHGPHSCWAHWSWDHTVGVHNHS